MKKAARILRVQIRKQIVPLYLCASVAKRPREKHSPLMRLHEYSDLALWTHTAGSKQHSIMSSWVIEVMNAVFLAITYGGLSANDLPGQLCLLTPSVSLPHWLIYDCHFSWIISWITWWSNASLSYIPFTLNLHRSGRYELRSPVGHQKWISWPTLPDVYNSAGPERRFQFAFNVVSPNSDISVLRLDEERVSCECFCFGTFRPTASELFRWSGSIILWIVSSPSLRCRLRQDGV